MPAAAPRAQLRRRGARRRPHEVFGRPLEKGFDAHVVAVNEACGCRVVERAMAQYFEVVFDQEASVMPVAVLWVKEP